MDPCGYFDNTGAILGLGQHLGPSHCTDLMDLGILVVDLLIMEIVSKAIVLQ